MLLLRALARLVTFVLLVVLAVLGLAVAVYAIGGGETLGPKLGLSEALGAVSAFLAAAEPDTVAVLGGIAAVIVGVALLLGALVPPRERLIVIEDGDDGKVGARPRPLGQIAEALAAQVRSVYEVRARVRPKRRRGGRLDVSPYHPRNVAGPEVKQSVSDSVEPLARGFDLKARVRPRLAQKGSRVA